MDIKDSVKNSCRHSSQMSPYQIFGGNLGGNYPYVSRKADEELFKLLKAGELCCVFNCRQMGKSSLFVKTRKALMREGVRCEIIDLSRVGQSCSPENFYDAIIQGINEYFGERGEDGSIEEDLLSPKELRQWYARFEYLEPVQKLASFIDNVLVKSLKNERIVIVFEEIDNLLGFKFDPSDFFSLIRSYHNNRALNPIYEKICFALVGVTTPAQLVSLTPNRVPFNVGHLIELTPLPFNEDSIAAFSPGLKGLVARPDKVLEQVFHWTGGQPFLTQWLCGMIWQKYVSSENISFIEDGREQESVYNLLKEQIFEYGFSGSDNNEFLSPLRKKWQDHRFQQIEIRLQNNGFANGMLSLYDRILADEYVVDDGTELQRQLQLTGLIISQNGQFKVFNRIYETIFDRAWVKRKLDTQRPYTETLNLWKATGGRDDQYLLKGNRLKEAVLWSRGKLLGIDDSTFLHASQELYLRKIEKALGRKENKIKELETKSKLEKKELEGTIKAREREERRAQFSKHLFRFWAISTLIASAVGIFMTSLANDNFLSRNLSNHIRDTEAYVNSGFYFDALISALYARSVFSDWDKSFLYSLGLRHWPRSVKKITEIDDEIDKLLSVSLAEVKELNRFKVNGVQIIRTSLSPDNEMIAGADSKAKISIWEPTGKILLDQSKNLDELLPIYEEINFLRFSSNGQWLYSGVANGNLIILSTTDGKFTHRGFIKDLPRIKDFEDSFESDIVVVTSWQSQKDQRLKVYDLSQIERISRYQNASDNTSSVEAQELKELAVPDELISVAQGSVPALSPDGLKLALLGREDDGQKAYPLYLWRDLKSKESSPELLQENFVKDPSIRVNDLVYGISSEGQEYLISLESNQADQKSIFYFDIKSRAKELLSDQLKDQVDLIAFDASNQILAIASTTGKMLLWDIEEKQLFGELDANKERITDIVFSEDGQILASSRIDGSIQIWDISNRSQSDPKIVLEGHIGEIKSIDISTDGNVLVSGGIDGAVRIWDLRDSTQDVDSNSPRTLINDSCKWLDGYLTQEGEDYLSEDEYPASIEETVKIFCDKNRES